MIHNIEKTLEGKQRRLSILAGLGAGFFVVGFLLTIALLILLWKEALVLFIVTLGCWASGFILKFIVNDKEYHLKYLQRKQNELEQKAEYNEDS